MTAKKNLPKSFQELKRMIEFLAIFYEGGVLSSEDLHEIGTAGGTVLVEQGGIKQPDPKNPSHVGLTKQAVHLMKQKFLELCPEHELELKHWFSHERNL